MMWKFTYMTSVHACELKASFTFCIVLHGRNASSLDRLRAKKKYCMEGMLLYDLVTTPVDGICDVFGNFCAC